MKEKKSKAIKSDDICCVNILNEVINEDGSATWTIEYDRRFVNILKKRFNLTSLKKEDMEKYFILFLKEAIKNYSDASLTTVYLDSISTKM